MHTLKSFLQIIHFDKITQVAMKVRHHYELIQVPSSDMLIRDLKLNILHVTMEKEWYYFTYYTDSC